MNREISTHGEIIKARSEKVSITIVSCFEFYYSSGLQMEQKRIYMLIYKVWKHNVLFLSSFTWGKNIQYILLYTEYARAFLWTQKRTDMITVAQMTAISPFVLHRLTPVVVFYHIYPFVCIVPVSFITLWLLRSKWC